MAKGWLDNYGTKENANDSSVSLPEGFVGMGNNTKGRNYSPAWGGSFQMGGYVYPVNYVPQAQTGMSMPGAVGFTYARTQGAAPSNGPYTKKTMASAQNGKEMQYYQNGLDYQPKTISKNGSWLSKYEEGGIIKDDRGQWDHPDEPTRISGGNITMKPDPLTGKPLTKPILGIADTGEEQMMYPGEDYNFTGAEYVDEYPKGKRPKKAQNGLRQEQKSLQNLDNLLNFTNYNKPQPGSWLEKYN